MRILHTSDWHLGRQLHRVPLMDEQRAFLEHLLDTVRREQIDAVAVAGDVFDRAIPPLDAIDLFKGILEELAALQVPLIMISGNHDSPRRLGVNARLIEHAGIHLRTGVEDCARPVILQDQHGPVAFYGLPYLEPGLVHAHFGTERASHHAVLSAAMDRVRADLADRPSGTRSVVLAHAFVTGADTSDSERDITAGGVPSVAASVFDGADYVALGHLHRCQKISERIRYSGSPLAYSFSEAEHPKAMWLIDLGADAAITARKVLCPVPRHLRQMTGALQELLTSPEYTAYETCWLHITLTDPDRPHMAMERLQKRFPHALKLSFSHERQPSSESYRSRVQGRTDHEIGLGFLHHVTGIPATRAEQDLLHEGLENVRTQAAAREAS
ncbi:exonuclease SbcCD subunit D [Streptomyces ipomoeae]|uniref:exonuclease SbcCD subunit D n=1 Tax=Streptomyces ipomoeae TaxID=103232 RepID=UPI0011474447|nr:exonuclease SbcCD subunit D [Streptomyces ipomoeae]MDX2936442.1 exonuclease SbcCD subunit D [Streptomyces ipomoeae]TQE24789.1 exonuclease SbcCD subunit D [Streptomyces ipomoeae]